MRASGPLGATVMRRLDELAQLTDVPGELTRLYLSPAHQKAAACVAGWMREAGMTAAVDAVGNVAGRLEGAGPDGPALLLGSHIDTVRNAGRYDGSLGVVAAIEAVAELSRRGERPPYAIEVLAFGDEEGVRFPMTLCGSKAVAGIFDAAALDCVDREGTRLRDALTGFGGSPDGIAGLARSREATLGYVELHIEQGPVLEAEGLPVGVVTAINGATRASLTVTGRAGHAGTVPMRLRQDALAAAAEMVLAIERRCAAEPDLVGTVGQLHALPGAVNVIPGEVRLTIDIRSPADGQRRAAVDDILAQAGDIAARRGVSVAHEVTYDVAAASCDPTLMGGLEAAIAEAGVASRRLPSGAGHDGLAIVALCPIAMLFVRCRGGISHHPAESITIEDADLAVRVLAGFLRRHRPDRG